MAQGNAVEYSDILQRHLIAPLGTVRLTAITLKPDRAQHHGGVINAAFATV